MLKKPTVFLNLCICLNLLLVISPTSLWQSPHSVAIAKVLVDEPPPQESELPSTEKLQEAPVTLATTSVKHTIYLQSREFVPEEPDLPSLQRLTVAGGDRMHILLQLDFIPRQVAKDALAESGIKLLAYVPDYAWIASVPAINPASVLQLPGVLWAGVLTIEDKLDPAIVNDLWESYNLAKDGTAAVFVVPHADVSLEDSRAAIARYGGRVTGEVNGIHLLVVEMPRINIRALAAEDFVQWIELAAPPLTGTNDGIRPQIGVDVLQALPYNLDGTGIDVLVYDSGQVGNHADFGTRLTHGDADSVSDHSTHVAGTLGGDGSNSINQGGTALQWRGMATNVDLISYGTGYAGTGVLFYQNVPDIEHDWAQAQNTYGADLGTASVGSNIYANFYMTSCNLMGNYGAASVLIDQIVRGGNSTVGIGDKYIATWAAGNERGWATSCAGVSGGYGLVAPPASAKNPIHVGGSNTNNNTQYAHTSWGPTDDGRLKPIVTAGACQTSGDNGIKSTDDNPVNAYTVKCGTSMATASVSGGIALMLQYYRDVYNTSSSFWPSTAKAILMQTADDLGNPGPDYQWGYGQVDIRAAVDLISRKAFRQVSIDQGEVDVYHFIVPGSGNDAMVSLAWDDFEATFNANPTLINNLDLELVAPSGTLWRPWILNPASPASTATRGVDNRNNQEQVQVPNPEIGTWLVRVKGTTVPQGPQDYSLACEGCQLLDLGVCQSSVGGSTAVSSLLVENPGLGDIAAEEGSSEEEALTAGELWQRTLEAQDNAQVADKDAEVQAAMAILEETQKKGPEAVVALLDTLDGKALDMVVDEIAEMRDFLLESTPPPTTNPVSEEEELAILQALDEVEEANRTQALTNFDDPAEGQFSGTVLESISGYGPTSPAVDRTVGNGCTYATIGAAIAAANPGDRLMIEGGRTFIENLTIPMTLTLRGGYNGCASGSAARTTIDGNASGSVVIVNAGIAVTLRKLNLTNGATGVEGGGIRFALGSGTGSLRLMNIDIYSNQSQWGGGLWVGQNAEVTGENVDIYDNTAYTYGGGVRLFGGRATFTNSYIHDNSAPWGGGVYATFENGYTSVLNLPSLTDVYDNQALGGDSLGGGVYLRQSTLSMADNSDIYSNNAVQGGGAYLVTSTLTMDGSSSWIYYNTATGNGGGIYAQGSSVNLDDGAELYDNDAGIGGGAYLDDSDLYVDKGSIGYNTATGHGGGVYATNASVVDMDLGSYTCLGTRCSRLVYNTSVSNYGGGIFANNSTVDLRNTFIENNTAVYGGGAYVYNSSGLYAYNSLFARNDSTNASNIGGAIRLNSASMTGAGNTLAYNDADGAATGQAIGIAASSLSLHCSIIWAHSSSIDMAGQDVTYSDIQGGYAGTGNTNVNPLFVNPSSSDYHLQNTSPVIDRCPQFGGMDFDFDNEVRPIVRLTAATPYDIGADEVAGADRVGVNGGGCTYATIQQAVNAASDGDTLQVAEGVYFENVNIGINQNLTIEGGYNSTCTTDIAGITRVEGSAGVGSTVDIYTNARVILRDLQIAWGNGQGGGVEAYSGAQVTLDNADVLNNHGSYGGGIYVSPSATMTTTNGTEIRNNTATIFGGGGRVWGQFFAYGNDSDIHDNCAPSGGGFSVPQGMLSLNAADVYLNEAAAVDGKGGGIYLTDGGVMTMTNASFVYYLNQAYDGGGIYADNASVSMQGSSTTVRDNVATNYGGGVYLGNNSVLHSVGARIGQAGSASIANEALYGAGLYVSNSTVDFSGYIQNNIAAGFGAGIFAIDSELRLEDTTVGGTGTGEANQLGPSAHSGVGLYLYNTHAELTNTTVASNTFQTTGFTYGGGAYVESSSVMTLTNSTVERHLAPSAVDGRGAGLYISGSTLNLDNSVIISNTAGTVGGGVRMWGTSTLNVLNGSLIRNNESLNGEGGGIAGGGTPNINISDSTLRNNRARTDGGAIYLDNGALMFTGGWTLRSNDAGGNGGAIAVVGTADADFFAQRYSLVYDNTALGGSGGFIYLVNNSTVSIYAFYGRVLYIYANAANQNGGALYADSGGYFDNYGEIGYDHNWATNGHGGAIYLSGGSRVWLDDYFTVGPELWDNRTYHGNGGAIYASNSPLVRLDGVTLGQSGEGNLARGGGSGGAVYLSGSTLSAENCIFQDNTATVHGGAIAAYTSTVTLHANYLPVASMATSKIEQHDALAPTAVNATACDPQVDTCSALFNNTADSDVNNTGYGGSIYAEGSNLSVAHTYFYNNIAIRGGAIYQTGSGALAEVNNTLIYSNTSTTAYGAGIRSANGVMTLTHVTLANNLGGAGYSQAAISGYVANSIAWGNTNGGFWVSTGTLNGTCNIDQSSIVGPAINPHFINFGVGADYHLVGDSPAIDACVTGLTPDLDNIPRPRAAAYDMGAYEYPHNLAFTPNRNKTGYAGTTVQYTHRITNTGSLTDTFTFSGASSRGWALTLPSPVTLGAGGFTQVTVKVRVPHSAPVGVVNTAVISATLDTDPTLSAQVVDKTKVLASPDISVAPLVFKVNIRPDEIKKRILTLDNDGTANLDWNLQEVPNRPWLLKSHSTGTILPAGTKKVTITFDPAGLANGTYTTTLRITSNDPVDPVVDVPVTMVVNDEEFIFLPLVMRNP